MRSGLPSEKWPHPAQRLRVTEAGRPFVRNVCMAFDARLYADKPQAQLFSMSI